MDIGNNTIDEIDEAAGEDREEGWHAEIEIQGKRRVANTGANQS